MLTDGLRLMAVGETADMIGVQDAKRDLPDDDLARSMATSRPDGSLDWSRSTKIRHLHQRSASPDRCLPERPAILRDDGGGLAPIEDDPSSPDVLVDYSRIWKATPKVVFSQTLEEAGWNARIVREDVEAEVIKLKREPGTTCWSAVPRSLRASSSSA
ncbi:MAG: hypothetical protein R2849_15825 [Thermomicrobiales bacterium]